MTDIELLPLPDWMSSYTIPADGFEYDKNVMLVDRMHDYARACVAHATAPLQAEIEALRAEVADLFGQLLACQHELDAATARAERLAEALRAVVADMREWGEPAKGAHVERIQRRLDDALRDHDQEVGNG